MSTAEYDEAMERALTDAATRVKRDVGRERFLERLLEDALAEAWKHETRGSVQARRKIPIRGWDPEPGGTDLLLSRPGESVPTAVAE